MNPLKSKINWLGIIMLVAGFLTDPAIIGVLPETWAPTIMKVGGAVTFIISQFFTKRAVDSQPLNIP